MTCPRCDSQGGIYSPEFIEELLRADEAPPAAAFDNAEDMLAHLNGGSLVINPLDHEQTK